VGLAWIENQPTEFGIPIEDAIITDMALVLHNFSEDLRPEDSSALNEACNV
jgi:hypothetical protein